MKGGVDDLGRAVRGGRFDVVTLDRRGQGHLVRVRMGGRVRGRVRVGIRVRARDRVVRPESPQAVAGTRPWPQVTTWHASCPPGQG